MMAENPSLEKFLSDALKKREEAQSLRKLTTQKKLIDFSSNDYLGFARSSQLKRTITDEAKAYPGQRLGSTGSRLITGNSTFYEALEKRIAQFHQAQSGLIFNAGYGANLGLFSTIPQRTDTIYYDALIHASIRDGIRLSQARNYAFRHNDLAHLAEKMSRAVGRIFVAVESVYSMDGDKAPLMELVALCQKYQANLIVDEAHATGIFGENGAGCVAELGLTEDVFARVHTFGKALGTHGAVVLGPPLLRSYLVNFCRPFIYTTALPFHTLLTIKCAYEKLAVAMPDILQLRRLIAFFKEASQQCGLDSQMIASDSPIQCVIMPGNEQVNAVAAQIQTAGFAVKAIRHPTVPAGQERLRICLHAFNSEAEISQLLAVIRRNKVSC